ncbi:MAG: ribonuclease HIII [Planctomycetota bacterium]
MAQQTVVVKLPRSSFDSIRDAIESAFGGAVEWRNVAHAAWSAKVDGVVATVYSSGKAVIQGATADAFVSRFFADGTTQAPKDSGKPSKSDAELPTDRPSFGSDEAGKGDYFGPLVVAAVRTRPEDHAWLEEAGVTDSKALSDRRAHELAGLLQSRLDHEVRSLGPTAYNERYRSTPNVNQILADMHADALDALAKRDPDVELTIVDRFGSEKLVRSALESRGRSFGQLIQVPRAERHPSVAAASVLARSAFLDGLQQCEEDTATDLHKGAGQPVDVAAKRVVKLGGRELLSKVAKMHFKNTGRAGLPVAEED